MEGAEVQQSSGATEATSLKAESTSLKAAVGRAIRLRRIELGMDQRALAERMGTTQARVSKIERGVQDLRLTTLGRLEEALGIQLLATVEIPPDMPGMSGRAPEGRPATGPATRPVATQDASQDAPGKR